jgi:ribose-phosphate pyrophosphokinase
LSLVLHFADEAALAQALALRWAGPVHRSRSHSFPDGEFRLTLPKPLPPRVVLLRGLQQPNAKLAALLIAAPTARECGARHLTLVAPYLSYMRQDMEFNPGEAVSQRHVGMRWPPGLTPDHGGPAPASRGHAG